MAHPYHHALSSVRKWGGKPEDYQRLHDWFDESKKITADFRHRALRHHAEGIFMAETVFGSTLTLSSGRIVPVRWIGEQHVREDLGFIPSFADLGKGDPPASLDGTSGDARNRRSPGDRRVGGHRNSLGERSAHMSMNSSEKPVRRIRSRGKRRRRVTKGRFNTGSGAEPQDVYTRVTNRIVADLEKGVRPWMRPWDAGNAEGRITRPLRHNGLPYSGINVLMLWSSAIEHGFSAPMWMTFKQAQELGAHVRKGEKGSLVVYANTVHKVERNDEGEEIERDIPFLKGYTVFNVEQIDGLPEHYYGRPPPKFNPVQRIEHAELFFHSLHAEIRHRGGRAYYAQEPDYIQLPPIEAFKDAESYYATLAHETTHWTKHPNRLAREFGRKAWGDEGYAQEELVAELGSAFLCTDLEITPEIREDHAAYIQSWLEVLKSDKRFIFQAAAHAQRAVDYLHRLQDGQAAPAPA